MLHSLISRVTVPDSSCSDVHITKSCADIAELTFLFHSSCPGNLLTFWGLISNFYCTETLFNETVEPSEHPDIYNNFLDLITKVHNANRIISTLEVYKNKNFVFLFCQENLNFLSITDCWFVEKYLLKTLTDDLKFHKNVLLHKIVNILYEVCTVLRQDVIIAEYQLCLWHLETGKIRIRCFSWTVWELWKGTYTDTKRAS